MSGHAHGRAQPDKSKTLKRGLRLRCPKCGEGRLLAGYLTPQKACTDCGESFEALKADDGPAWLTVLVVALLFSFIKLGVSLCGSVAH